MTVVNHGIVGCCYADTAGQWQTVILRLRSSTIVALRGHGGPWTNLCFGGCSLSLFGISPHPSCCPISLPPFPTFAMPKNLSFLARDAFTERIVALLPRRSSVCPSVRLSVRLSGTDVHCDHTVHFSADLILWMDSPMFWAPWHQSMSTYSQPSFCSSTWKRAVVWMCKLGLHVLINTCK